MEDKKFKRKCVVCSKYREKSGLIRLTVDYVSKKIKLNKFGKVFGHSFYICKDKNCIEEFAKMNAKAKYTKHKTPQEVVDKILKIINFEKN